MHHSQQNKTKIHRPLSYPNFSSFNFHSTEKERCLLKASLSSFQPPPLFYNVKRNKDLNKVLFFGATKMANSSFVFDTLYCSEESWEDVEEESCFNNGINDNKSNFFPILLEQDLSWEDGELPSLLSKEEQNQLYDRLQSETNGNLARTRLEAVGWMLKVNAHYSFSALTAVLAVNYLDRFLFSFRFQSEKPWTTQLAAVACLSLAAKVEETHVPLLLDLQVEETRYIFEAKTIQRMEILILSSLKWKMNPVTPHSFLDYIARRLGLKDYLCWEFLKRCDRILLSVISDSRFMCYLPSVMATATMLHVMHSVEPDLRVEYQNQLLGILGIDKDKVNECCELIMESATRFERNQSNKRWFDSIPGSPNGVIDVSFSSDSWNKSWAVASLPSSVSSSPEPMTKKMRTQQDQLLERLNHSPPDFLSIPH